MMTRTTKKQTTKSLKRNCLLGALILILLSCDSSEVKNIDNPTQKSNEKAILSFSINSSVATINEAQKNINIQLPSGTNVSSLSPKITISSKATISPKSESITNFINPVVYTVTAEDGTQVNYTVSVTIIKSSEKDILSFDLICSNLSNFYYTHTPDTVIGYVNQTTKEIIFTSQESAKIENVTPLIKVSNKATVTPNSMIGQDFNIPLTYTVKAEDGTTNQYSVKFTKKKFSSSSTSFLSLSPYIRPNKTTVKVNEEIMVEITGANLYALVNRNVYWSKPVEGGGTLVSSPGATITKVNYDGTIFYFKLSSTGNYSVWLEIEDYISSTTYKIKSNKYSITVQ